LSQFTFGDRAPPNLGSEHRCGDSRIVANYFAGNLIVDTEEMKRVNPLDGRTASAMR
jgi:hypothetical protein